MGFLGVVSPRALATSALLFSSLACDVFALPSPEPKAPWVRNGYAKKKLSDQAKRAVGCKKRSTELPSCSEDLTTKITAPKPNPWAPLSDFETASVVAWLFAQEDLNLTVTADAGSWDNTIAQVEAMWPNKTAVVDFLDSNGPAPVKYSHVVLNNRASVDAHYADIIVGPLPISEATTWEPLTFPFTKQNGGKVRNLNADMNALYESFIIPLATSIADITLDLWNATYLGLDNDTIDVMGIDPLWQDDGRIKSWNTFFSYGSSDMDSFTLLPLGLYFLADVTGRNPSQWILEGWLYNDIFYETTEDFRSAYFSEGFVKNGPAVDGPWAWTDKKGEPLPLDEAATPLQIAPAGNRFSIDEEQQYIEWMGFSFYLGFTRDIGLNLHDIRYEGERILYELSMQEALAHYAGNDPTQSGTAYLDSYYGFGPYAFELVKGYDCPAHAVYLNSSFYVSETHRIHVDSICLFEFDADYVIQRHSTREYVSITKNTYFVVRYVATIGNYDYTFSYSFFLDGSIAVEVRASGYIQSAYFAANKDYGFQIHDTLSGSMHDHVINFKADFDILGTENSVELMSMMPTTTTYPWSKGKARNTMKLERSFIETEDDGKLDWHTPTQLLVVNEQSPNQYGELRGYRVLPYTGASHLTVLNSSNLNNAARWAEHDIYVTKRKDTEPRSAHPYNTQDTFEPPVDFSKFFDGESLRNEDLVLWLNLGMHHVPHTGDLPNTVMTTAHSGIQFMPSNYFAGDESRRTHNQVRVKVGGGDETEVETFGQFEADAATCKLDYTPVDADLESYVGDIVVRKFPFDPNNPFTLGS